MASVELKNLTKRWGDFVAVDNQSLRRPTMAASARLPGPNREAKRGSSRMASAVAEISSAASLARPWTARAR